MTAGRVWWCPQIESSNEGRAGTGKTGREGREQCTLSKRSGRQAKSPARIGGRTRGIAIASGWRWRCSVQGPSGRRIPVTMVQFVGWLINGWLVSWRCWGSQGVVELSFYFNLVHLLRNRYLCCWLSPLRKLKKEGETRL